MTASCNFWTKQICPEGGLRPSKVVKGDPMFMKIMFKRLLNVFSIIGETEYKFDLVRN